MYFHCDRPLIDEPSKLVGILATQGIASRLSEDRTRIDLTVARHDIAISIRRERFRDRLAVFDIERGLGVDTLSPKDREACQTIVAAIESGDLRPSWFAKRRLEMADVADWFVENCGALGWTIVADPVEAEIEYAQAHFISDSITAEIIDAIRNEQDQMRDAIAAEQFEREPEHGRRLFALLNRLYEYCVA